MSRISARKPAPPVWGIFIEGTGGYVLHDYSESGGAVYEWSATSLAVEVGKVYEIRGDGMRRVVLTKVSDPSEPLADKHGWREVRLEWKNA